MGEMLTNIRHFQAIDVGEYNEYAYMKIFFKRFRILNIL